MHRWLLNHIPTSLFMFLFVVGAVLFAYGVLQLMRRFFPSLADGEHNEITALSVEMVGAIYAILLGFVIVFLWQGVNDARDNVGREATALSQVMRDAETFPLEIRDQVIPAAREYAHAVVDEEWGELREGRRSLRADMATTSLYSVLQRYEPRTETQKTFYVASVDHFNEMLAARRTRLDHVGPSLSGSLRFMIYAYFVVIVVFISSVGNGPRGRHAIMLLGVTAIIAFNLALMTTFDYPFSGDGAVTSEPFQTGQLAQFFPY